MKATTYYINDAIIENNLQLIRYYVPFLDIIGEKYDKSMWCCINFMCGGCASIPSECKLSDLANRLY